MPPKKQGDDGENPDKLNFSKTQLTVIIGSIAAIVVLAVALGFVMKKDEAQVEEQAQVEAPPTETATEMPPLPEGTKQEELSKLENALPSQVPLTPEEELAKKAEEGTSAPAPTPVPAPAKPAPVMQEKTPASATAPGAIVEKTAALQPVMEKKAEPKPEAKAHREKPKKKKIKADRHIELKPLKKHVDVKKKIKKPSKSDAKKEKAKADKKVAKAEGLKNRPSDDSFTTELEPNTIPPAPVTVEAPVKAAAPAPAPAPAQAAPAAAAKFTLLAETVASEKDAQAKVGELKKSGYYAYYLKVSTPKTNWYRVMVGAYATQDDAESAADELSEKENISAKILPYEKP